jgi:rifampicin phosphotransferase
MNSSIVIPLAAAALELELVGGKARSLMALQSRGFSVPAGFVVSTNAYRGFVDDYEFSDRILQLAVPEIANGGISFARAALAINALFSHHDVPEAVADAITTAHKELGAPPVAVRSSANAEDLPELSFAGQQETFLNVLGQDQVVLAVRDCWASLWTERALTYRHEMGINHSEVAMAVVVQAMVPADSAGVLFTANPVSGQRGEIVINASYGLGEAVVGGTVTPDSCLIDRASLTIVESIIGAKAERIVSRQAGGTVVESVDAASQQRAAVSSEALLKLADLAMQVEAKSGGSPLDIEWAIVGGEIYLLQSRPITHLPPPPIEDVRWEPPAPVKQLRRRQVVEMMPEPLSPLFEDLYLREAQDAANWEYQQKQDFPFRIDGPWYLTVNGYGYQRGDIAIRGRRDEEAEQRFFYGYAKRFRWWWQTWTSKADAGRFLVGVAQAREWRRSVLSRYLDTVTAWERVEVHSLSNRCLYEAIRTLGLADAMYWATGTSKAFGLAKIADQALQDFLARACPDTGLTSGQFLTGFDSLTLASNRARVQIVAAIRSNVGLYEFLLKQPKPKRYAALQAHPDGDQILQMISEFLDRYGHQIHNLDYVQAPVQEDPARFVADLDVTFADIDDNNPGRVQEVGQRRAEAMAQVKQQLHGREHLAFRWRLFVARYFYPLREETGFYVGLAWPVLRRFALCLGEQLAVAGTIVDAEDVFYLRAAEIEADIEALEREQQTNDRRAVVTQRRLLREARKRLHPPSVLPPEDHDKTASGAVAHNNALDATILSGYPVSPGIVRGVASVIDSPEQFSEMLPGSILVCAMTTPAWTQLFSRANGLVTDIGGITSHGSIVAREYGIPAVLGTGNITERVKSGDILTVNGDAGTVTIELAECATPS